MEKTLADYPDQLIHPAGHEVTAETLSDLVALRALEHLIGPVSGRNVLDFSCGDGRLSRWLAVHGAQVTGVDKSVEAIESARRKESRDPRGIIYHVGEAEDLYMLDDSAFDDVICHMSLDKFESLSAVIAEVARIICLGGRFIFSVGHPCFEPQLIKAYHGNSSNNTHNYFNEELRPGFSGIVRHRTLATYINAVAARGFTVRRIMEPSAEEWDITKPELEIWQNVPVALVVEAVFPHL